MKRLAQQKFCPPILTILFAFSAFMLAGYLPAPALEEANRQNVLNQYHE